VEGLIQTMKPFQAAMIPKSKRKNVEPAELRNLIHSTFEKKVDRRDVQHVIDGLIDETIEPKSQFDTPSRKAFDPTHGELTRRRHFDNPKEFVEENNCLDDYNNLKEALQNIHGIELPELQTSEE
jgi:hypothetical protein